MSYTRVHYITLRCITLQYIAIPYKQYHTIQYHSIPFHYIYKYIQIQYNIYIYIYYIYMILNILQYITIYYNGLQCIRYNSFSTQSESKQNRHIFPAWQFNDVYSTTSGFPTKQSFWIYASRWLFIICVYNISHDVSIIALPGSIAKENQHFLLVETSQAK